MLGGSQDFSNEVFQVLEIQGFRNEDLNTFKMREHEIIIKPGAKERKEELLDALKAYFQDGIFLLMASFN